MDTYTFSFNNYRKLCNCIRNADRLCDYADILRNKPDKFIILRHDVEFSPERAYALAKFENELNITSSYFFQITNNAYNILSKRNIDLMRKIATMGHHVGLHFHLNGLTDILQISAQVKYEAVLLSDYLNMPVDRFSFHRPSPIVLENNIQIDGLINAYAPEFFTYYSGNGMPPQHLDVKYVADSKNSWQYTAPYPYPNADFFLKYDKIQILCHPYTWTQTGYSTLSNLRSLIDEKRQEFIQTLNSETKYVKEYLDEL